MTIALLALLLIEAVLLVSWNRAYFAWGLPLFNRRIAVPTSALVRFPFGRLQVEVASEKWPELLFRPLSKRSCAFRESLGIHFGWRYPPIMRGLIVIDRQRREIRVVGWCNWTVLYALGTLIAAVAAKPAAAPIVALLLGVSYLMQRRRFAAVDAAVRRLLTS